MRSRKRQKHPKAKNRPRFSCQLFRFSRIGDCRARGLRESCRLPPFPPKMAAGCSLGKHSCDALGKVVSHLIVEWGRAATASAIQLRCSRGWPCDATVALREARWERRRHECAGCRLRHSSSVLMQSSDRTLKSSLRHPRAKTSHAGDWPAPSTHHNFRDPLRLLCCLVRAPAACLQHCAQDWRPNRRGLVCCAFVLRWFLTSARAPRAWLPRGALMRSAALCVSILSSARSASG